MRDYWIDGLIAVATLGSLYWTLRQMAQQAPLVIQFPSDSDGLPADDSSMRPNPATTSTTAPGIILGSDQPVDEDPDFDLDMDDLGAIATFDNQRL